MEILENNFTTFNELLEEYEYLQSKKESLENEINKSGFKHLESVVNKEIKDIDSKLEKIETARLYTQRGIDNMKAWKEI